MTHQFSDLSRFRILQELRAGRPMDSRGPGPRIGLRPDTIRSHVEQLVWAQFLRRTSGSCRKPSTRPASRESGSAAVVPGGGRGRSGGGMRRPPRHARSRPPRVGRAARGGAARTIRGALALRGPPPAGAVGVAFGLGRMIVCIPVTEDGLVDPRRGRAGRVAVATVQEGRIESWQESRSAGCARRIPRANASTMRESLAS